jgi:hypothetical protein
MIYVYLEPWWKDIDRGIMENLEKSLYQRRFAHHKFHKK